MLILIVKIIVATKSRYTHHPIVFSIKTKKKNIFHISRYFYLNFLGPRSNELRNLFRRLCLMTPPHLFRIQSVFCLRITRLANYAVTWYSYRCPQINIGIPAVCTDNQVEFVICYRGRISRCTRHKPTTGNIC